MFLSHSEGSETSVLPVPHHRSVIFAVPVTLAKLLNLVAARIPSKWKEFGILLNIPSEELEAYPSHHCTECFTRVFVKWKSNNSPDYTWETVINNLESPIINEKRLAQEIRSIVTTRHSPPPSYSTEPLSRPAVTVDSRTKTLHAIRYELETDV